MLQHHDPQVMHVYTDQGRYYNINGAHYPGVGNIQDATQLPQVTEYWKQWRSHPDNAAKSEAAKQRGTLFHWMVEQELKLDNYQDALIHENVSDVSQLEAVAPYFRSVKNVLPRITDVQLIESAVWHEVGCYAGTVDLVCKFDSVDCILDWKTATKPKHPEYLERYQLQSAAYAGCVNRMYGTRIKHGVVVVALPDREAQVFQFELKPYWDIWIDKVRTYWEQERDNPLAEIALQKIEDTYSVAALPDLKSGKL